MVRVGDAAACIAWASCTTHSVVLKMGTECNGLPNGCACKAPGMVLHRFSHMILIGKK